MFKNTLKRSVLSWIAVFFELLLVIYIVLGVFWVPNYVEREIASAADERLDLTMHAETNYFNPFTFQFSLGQIEFKSENNKVLSMDTLDVNFDPASSLYRGQYTFETLRIESPDIRIRRDESKQLNWLKILSTAEIDLEVLQQFFGSGWGISIDNFHLTDGTMSWSEHQWETESPIKVRNLKLKASSLVYPLGDSLPFNLKLKLDDGVLAVGGALKRNETYEIEYSVENMPLSPADGFVRKFIRGHIASGHLNARGEINGRLNGTGITMNGSGRVHDFELADEQHRQIFTISSLSFDETRFGLDEPSLEVTGLSLDTPVLNVIRDSSGKVNLKRLLKTQKDAIPLDRDVPEKKTLAIKLGPTKIHSGQVNFQDRFFDEEVRTHLNDISGTVGIATNNPNDTVTVAINAVAGGETPVRTRATIAPQHFDQRMKLTTRLRGLSLTKFSPYSTKYIGHRIDGGKLNLFLDYTISNAILTGTNELTLNRFNVGDRINRSPVIEAPVKLGIALLKDNDDQINMSIPIKGNLRKPEFQMRSVINQAISNAIGKVLWAPFNFLAGMVGASPADLRSIKFEPGESELSDKARTNLDKLVEALQKRPQIQLEIRPVWAKPDRQYFVRQILQEKLKKEGGEPDDLARSKKALEAIFDRTFSYQQRQAILEKHTHQSEDSYNEILDRDRYLNQLYEQLHTAINVDKEQLDNLAKRRAKTILSTLRNRDISSSRLYMLDRKRIDEEESVVSLPLELSAN